MNVDNDENSLDWKRFRQAYLDARAKFLANEEVLGVGYGPRTISGKEVVEWALIVLVAEDLAPDRTLKTGQILPITLDGFPIDIRKPRMEPHEHGEGRKPTSGHSDFMMIDWGKVHREHMNLQGPQFQFPTCAQLNTNQVGQVFVIEDYQNTLFTSSGYPDWPLAYQYFRLCWGDYFDFVTMTVDTASRPAGSPTSPTFGDCVYNMVQGISHWRGDNYNARASYGTNRLLGVEGFYPSSIIKHWFRLMEIGHVWGACVPFKNTSTDPSDHLNLLSDYAHWAEGLSDDVSPMGNLSPLGNGGIIYTDKKQRVNGLDTFSYRAITDGEFVYSPLDLYLMGMAPPCEVPPFYYIDGVNFDASLTPACYTGTRKDLTLDNIKWAAITPANPTGERIPIAAESPRSFRQAFIVLTQQLAKGSTLAATINSHRIAHTVEFRTATRSRGMVDTYLYNDSYDGVYIRDNVNDAGLDNNQDANVPSPIHPFWDSPDIWVRNQNDGIATHQAPHRGFDNWVYVRIQNNGPQPSGEITVNLFQANFAGAEFLYPEDWRQEYLIGSQVKPSVPVSPGEVIVKFLWRRNMIPSAAWHACLLVEILPIHRVKRKLRHVWDDRRLAQKNVTILEWTVASAPLKPVLFPFSIGSRSLPARLIKVRVQQKEGLPVGKMVLELGREDWLSRLGNIRLRDGEGVDLGNIRSIGLNALATGGVVIEENDLPLFVISNPLEGAEIALPLLEAERRELTLKLAIGAEALTSDAKFEITQLNEQNNIVGGLDLVIRRT